MKTTSISIVIATIVATTIAVGSASVYAGSVSNGYNYVKNIVSGKNVNMKGKGNRGNEYGILNKFVDIKTLTEAQQKEIKALITGHQAQMQQLMQSTRGLTGDKMLAVQTQITDLQKNHFNALRKFIPADKLADFDKLVTEMSTNKFNGPRMNGKGPEMKGKGPQMKGKREKGDRGNEYGILNKFVDIKTLTEAQQKEIKALITGHQAQMQQLMQSTRGLTGDKMLAVQTQITDLQKNHFNALRKFIPADKLADFDKLVTEMSTNKFNGPRMNGKDPEMKGKNTEMKGKGSQGKGKHSK